MNRIAITQLESELALRLMKNRCDHGRRDKIDSFDFISPNESAHCSPINFSIVASRAESSTPERKGAPPQFIFPGQQDTE